MKKRTKIILAVLALLIIAGIIATVANKGKNEVINFQTTQVEPGDISTTITATGTIEPVKTVDVGTQVSGIVKRLYVDYNSVVRRGQVIAELDRTNLLSDLTSAQAHLRTAQIELDYQKKNYARFAELKQKDLVSLSEYDIALENYRKAQESVRIAQQDVARAKTNLGYATVYSPIDGVVISKSVEEGQTVASSFSTPSICRIAKDLTDMQCIAKVDEADIGEVREGQRVTFTVDAYPDDVFSGSVKQVRQNPVTTNNVVTYEVVISAPNADFKLKPGLTANITIYTMERSGVMSVPAAALRFTPEASVFGKKYVIKDTTAEHKLWTLDGNVLTAHKVEIGVTDGTRTEVIGGMKEGSTVIQSFEIGAAAPADKKDATKQDKDKKK
ncbi:MAG: efflux RND transporter periplasmic adaptor subunit [Muribaculaceae bacterium]|jgi:HlyD family secretion protein|nr:efflux RND transporter periplasmic adaptor subunit [Muribaculaceae bacterium]MBR0492845.1 efflux RND transporter periplasmic adaptor subunit [Muribaculaceae bacterium]MBR3728116.1 efflux RND transporter periplasmic adaptor subunit [Muribaculaceae bacterium]